MPLIWRVRLINKILVKYGDVTWQILYNSLAVKSVGDYLIITWMMCLKVSSGSLVPAIDLHEDDKSYTVRAEIPGVKKEDIDVTVHDGVLTINAESRYEHEEKEEGRVIRQERRYGKYVRTIRIDVN
jgi:hypothetical protein